MKRNLIFTFVIFISISTLNAQGEPNHSLVDSRLKEFELINICHCHEYLMLRSYDYVKWKSEAEKQKSLEADKKILFDQYKSGRQFRLYYQEKYDSSLVYNKGVSIVADDTDLDFTRLDSNYYEPIVQHYVNEEAKSNPVPYLGLRHNNFFWDCFNAVGNLPLRKEFELFIEANQLRVE